MGQLQEAIQTLQMAMSLCAVKRTGSSAKRQSKRVELNSADCVSVFLELAEALWLNGEQVSGQPNNCLQKENSVFQTFLNFLSTSALNYVLFISIAVVHRL